MGLLPEVMPTLAFFSDAQALPATSFPYLNTLGHRTEPGGAHVVPHFDDMLTLARSDHITVTVDDNVAVSIVGCTKAIHGVVGVRADRGKEVVDVDVFHGLIIPC